MRKKLLHVINSLKSGGAETLLVNSLSPGGLCEHTENYLVYFAGSSSLIDKLDKSVSVSCLHYKGGLDIVRALKQLRKIIIDNKIDIVHSHLNPAGVYTHFICPKNIPQVHTIHTTYSMDNETSRLKLWMEKYFFFKRKDANIILLSDYTKDDFLKTIPFKGRNFVLNNFVADDYFDIAPKQYDATKKILRLFAVGNLKPLKNHVFIFEALKHLKDYNITLDIFGEGDKAAFENIINNSGIKVRLMGYRENLQAVFSHYDLFIMPSKFEGFPLSVFEAMAASVPVMLSDIAPLRSIVKDNALYFGLDDTEGLSSQLLAVLNNEIDINAMAAKAAVYARATVARGMYIKRLLEIYGQL